MSGEHRKQPEEQPSQEEPWLSHHDGRVTGTKVPPGAGDEEAGLTGDDPPTLEGDDDYGTPAYSVLDEAGFGFANDDESTKPAKEAE